MSKNFELLYQMGKAQSILQPEPENEVKSANAAVLQEEATATPALEVSGMAREEINKLVHRLFFLPGTDAPHHVVFAGTESGNGCTWMCAHVSEILAAQVGNSICVVDCNLGSAALHEQFGVENPYGLGNALAGESPIREYARQLSRPNLWLISAGTVDADSAKLLTSGRMRRRIAELQSEFDFVLLDVAAMNASNHGLILGSWLDGLVLVVKANSSRRDSTREAIQQLQASSVRMLGAVLNQRTFPIPEKIYKRL